MEKDDYRKKFEEAEDRMKILTKEKDKLKSDNEKLKADRRGSRNTNSYISTWNPRGEKQERPKVEEINKENAQKN